MIKLTLAVAASLLSTLVQNLHGDDGAVMNVGVAAVPYLVDKHVLRLPRELSPGPRARESGWTFRPDDGVTIEEDARAFHFYWFPKISKNNDIQEQVPSFRCLGE